MFLRLRPVRCAGLYGETDPAQGQIADERRHFEILGQEGTEHLVTEVLTPQAGEAVCLSLRTERLRFAPEPSGSCHLEGTLMERRYAGGAMRATIRLDDGCDILVLCGSADQARGEVGQRVFLSWNPDEAPVVRA